MEWHQIRPPGTPMLAVVGAMLPLRWRLDCRDGGCVLRAEWKEGCNPMPALIRPTYARFVPDGGSVYLARAKIIREAAEDLGAAIASCLSDRQPPA